MEERPFRSPFFSVPGAIQQWPGGPRRPPILPYLTQLVQTGKVQPRDIDILELLLNHRYLTFHQLYRLCFTGSWENAKHRVKALDQRRLIATFSWGLPNEESKTRHPIHCLDEGGWRLLSHYRGLAGKRWSASQNVRAMDAVWGILVANELYIVLLGYSAELPKDRGLLDFSVEPQLVPPGSERPIKMIPTATMLYNAGDGPKRYIVEAVRGEDGPKWLAEKAAAIMQYVRQLEAEEQPQLLVIAETEEQARATADAWYWAGEKPEKLLFTTDQAILDGAITHAGCFRIQESQCRPWPSPFQVESAAN